MNRFFSLFAATLIAATAPLPAQDQPPQAINNQDEVIAIEVNEDFGPDDVLEILRSEDKFETNDYVTRAVELQNSAALEMRMLIAQAVAAEKGNVRAVKTKPTDGSEPRDFLVITTTPRQMPSIVETIQSLDLNGFVNRQGSTRVAIRTKYRKASELAQIIDSTRASSDTDLFADDLTNTLYFDDSDYVANAILPYVQFFDVPVPQVEFDVRIIEVREDDLKELGLDWDAWKRTVGGQFDLTGNFFDDASAFGRLDGLLTLDATVLANFLNYTVQNGTTELVQRSRINASNLEPAVISDLRRIPVIDYVRAERTPMVVTESNPKTDASEDYGINIASDDPRIVTIVPPVTNQLAEIASDEEGMVIVIQPVITTDAVRAEIDIAVNTITAFDELERPILTEQTLQNRFTLQNGEEILLGTLERENVVRVSRGIPGLKDIPILGYIFGVESADVERSRVFILATPKFSNISFGARTLAEQRDQIPTLLIEDRAISLDYDEDAFRIPGGQEN